MDLSQTNPKPSRFALCTNERTTIAPNYSEGESDSKMFASRSRVLPTLNFAPMSSDKSNMMKTIKGLPCLEITINPVVNTMVTAACHFLPATQLRIVPEDP
jgi:hypothetical protein